MWLIHSCIHTLQCGWKSMAVPKRLMCTSETFTKFKDTIYAVSSGWLRGSQ